MGVGFCWECEIMYRYRDEDFEKVREAGCPLCGCNSGISIEAKEAEE